MAMCSEVFKPCGIDCNGPDKLYIQAPAQQHPPPVYEVSPPIVQQSPVPALLAEQPAATSEPSFQEAARPMSLPTGPALATTDIYGTGGGESSSGFDKAEDNKKLRLSAGFQAAKAGGASEEEQDAEYVEGGWAPSENLVSVLNTSAAVDKSEPEPEMQGDGIDYDPARERNKSIALCGLAMSIIFGITGLFLIGRLTRASVPVCDPRAYYRSCMSCGSGLALPVGGEWENSWPPLARAPYYFMCTMWLFLGVAIVCDQFMASIEKITSREKAVWMRVKGGAQSKFHVRVWNATIANLTLMALGSSAPEILLSCIELVGNSFFAAQLGPSTIVGSAAFNLLVITAVCVSALPPHEIRRVEVFSVFMVTASVSLWAYLWLLIILMFSSPNRVDVFEGLLTFFMFPILLIIAYIADRGYLAKLCIRQESEDQAEERIRKEQDKLSKMFSKQISFNAVKLLMETQKVHGPKGSQRRTSGIGKMVRGANTKGLTFGFKDNATVVLECEQTVAVAVVASRAPGCTVQIRYATREQDAKAGKRFVHTEGIITFEPHECEKEILVPIIDDNTSGHATVEFGIELDDLHVLSGSTPRTSGNISLINKWNRVIIVEDDDAGVVGFDTDEVMVGPGMNSVTVNIGRTGGNVGDITVSYRTVTDSAIEEEDFTPTSGILEFRSGQDSSQLVVQVRSTKPLSDRRFRIVLSNATGGARFDPNTDGGETHSVCEVIIPGQHKRKRGSIFPARAAMEEWKEQFVAAMYVGGGPEEQSQASNMDVFMHVTSVFWKLCFAFVPPPAVAGGWACFWAALFMIGCVTALIGDAASLLGCSMGINDEITAITLVALGTSLPDTLASKTAALQDDTADNSVGNVTGSNSVNVFLGLGLPWTLGAVYWRYVGHPQEWLDYLDNGVRYETQYAEYMKGSGGYGSFIVPAGSLGFSVGVFVFVASMCLVLLYMRRQVYGGELGGPTHACKRDSCILVSLWCVYIIASILKSIEVL